MKRVEVVSNDALAVQVEVEEAAVEDDVVVALEQVHHGLLHPRRNHAEVAHFDQCINLIFGSMNLFTAKGQCCSNDYLKNSGLLRFEPGAAG